MGLYHKERGEVLDIFSLVIGIIIGVVGALFLGVNRFTKKVEEEEVKIDDHSPENEEK